MTASARRKLLWAGATTAAGLGGLAVASPFLITPNLTRRLNRASFDRVGLNTGDANLYRPIAIEEAEKRETYKDPFGRCPAVPFGYLNAAWQEFLAKRPWGAELWMVEDPISRRISGYAWVRLGLIHHELIVRG